jgi:hypothetical protein
MLQDNYGISCNDCVDDDGKQVKYQPALLVPLFVYKYVVLTVCVYMLPATSV